MTPDETADKINEVTAKISALDQAKIRQLDAETRYFEAQTLRETHVGEQHRLAALEAARLHRELGATNSNNRVYDFIKSVNAGTCEHAIDTISRWRRQSSDPITIRINSPGGDVIEGLALYDFLLGVRASGIKITTAVLGVAASMAGVLLQAGDVRVISPNAHILIHEASSRTAGKLTDMKDETKFLEGLNERNAEILASRSTMSTAEILARAERRDWWLTSGEAISLGFADISGYV